MPRLKGRRRTRAPLARATWAVVSVDPSSMTRTSKFGACSWIPRTTSPTVADSLYAGTTARYDGEPLMPGDADGRAVRAPEDSLRRLLPRAVLVLLLVATAELCAWALLVPAFRGPAEAGHFAYVQKIADAHTVPWHHGARRDRGVDQ